MDGIEYGYRKTHDLKDSSVCMLSSIDIRKQIILRIIGIDGIEYLISPKWPAVRFSKLPITFRAR